MITLSTKIEEVVRVAELERRALAKLGLRTVGDLIYHFPTRYSDTSSLKNIRDIVAGETVSIYGQVTKLKLGKSFRTKMTRATATITDETGSIEAVWFHQPYIAKMLAEGTSAKFSGRVSARKTGGVYIANPEYELVGKIQTVGTSLFKGASVEENDEAALFPVYPESRGISSRWLYHSLKKILTGEFVDSLVDPIPTDILKKYNLPTLQTALIWIHLPRRVKDAEAARKRFAFEEVFFIQLAKQSERAAAKRQPAFTIEKTPEDLVDFTSHFPFKETDAQKKAVAAILEDMRRGEPMSRLLEGDVGSGKTAVAAATTYATISSRPQVNGGIDGERQKFGALQVAYMCPTEILANQHFESFIRYFFHLGTPIGLLTSSGCKKFPSKVNPQGWTDISRTQLLKWVASGEIPILIGTHSLIQKAVAFKHLACVIIDEQHRFGTAQRQKLTRKDGLLPHLLSMTATPIPRTLALTIFGDLDLTLLDQLPAGRKQIITELVRPDHREEIYEKVRHELAAGRQAYVICPRIDEPDPDEEVILEAKSVKAEARRLKKDIFPEYQIAILHSKMSPAAKEQTMRDFAGIEQSASGISKTIRPKVDILVATSLVEVGVNVPNATVIIIEGAERFGLAQLHQLRGRVQRSSHQAYCYVFTKSGSEKTTNRLKALATAKNGFELAEADLQLRGAGELYSGKQWGISDVAMEALKNQAMVEAARTEAKQLVETDPTLAHHPSLKTAAAARAADLHFE